MDNNKIKKSIHAKEYHSVISMIREYRESKGFTQKELAAKIGTDQTFISKVENSERRLDIIELRTICKALDISLVDFIQELETHLVK